MRSVTLEVWRCSRERISETRGRLFRRTPPNTQLLIKVAVILAGLNVVYRTFHQYNYLI